MPVTSDVEKSSLVCEYFELVTVRPEKSDPLDTLESDAAPLVLTVTVVVERGLLMASTTRPIAFLMVAISISTVSSDDCR